MLRKGKLNRFEKEHADTDTGVKLLGNRETWGILIVLEHVNPFLRMETESNDREETSFTLPAFQSYVTYLLLDG